MKRMNMIKNIPEREFGGYTPLLMTMEKCILDLPEISRKEWHSIKHT